MATTELKKLILPAAWREYLLHKDSSGLTPRQMLAALDAPRQAGLLFSSCVHASDKFTGKYNGNRQALCTYTFLLDRIGEEKVVLPE